MGEAEETLTIQGQRESAGTDPCGGVVVVGFGAAVSMALGNREELNLIMHLYS